MESVSDRVEYLQVAEIEDIDCINQPLGISWSPYISICLCTVRHKLATSLLELHYILIHYKGDIIPIRSNDTISEYNNTASMFDQIALW